MQLRNLVVLLFLVLVSTPARSQSDGVPHLDLVKGLRDRGYHDLALEYLEKLQALPTLNGEIKAALPLELARSRAEVAGQLPMGAERDQLLQRSRNDLAGYLKTTPPAAQAHEAELALANAIAEQARGLAFAAGRAGSESEPQPPKAKELLGLALARFDEADKVYATVQKKLEDEAGIKPAPEKAPGKTPPTPPRAPPLYLQILFQRAQTRYDKSRVPGAGVRVEGLANDDARQLADKLAAYRIHSPLGWQGYALFARTLEGADDARATTISRQIESATVAMAAPAQRQVRYYALARADASSDITAPSPARNQLRSQAERWLQLYGATSGSARDAQHVRYILIRLLAKEIEEVPENRRHAPEVQTRLERALTLIDAMDNGRAEHQEALERMKYSLLKLSGRAGGPIDTLKSFDEALLRTSLEFYQLQAAEEKVKNVGDSPIKASLQEQFTKQNEVTLAAARKALALMPTSAPERNRIRVLNMLQIALRRANDGARAAIICEYIAVTARQPDIAQAAAAEALRLYQYLSRANGIADPVAAERMMTMARLLDQRFPNSPQANEGRAILGRDLIARRQFDAAIASLSKIPKSEPSYATARYYAGLAAWAKHRDVHKDKLKTKSAESHAALVLLNEAIQAFAGMKTKDEQEQRLEVQAQLLKVGIHDMFGDSDAVIQTATPLLTRIEKKQLPPSLAAGVEMQVLDAAMSAYLRKKDFQQGALKVLAVLQARRGDASLGDVTAFLQSTAARIRQQLEEYEKQGPAAQAQYQATRDSFRQFLELIDKDPTLPPKQRLWLGSSFAAIGLHAKAAAVLAGIPPVTPAPGAPAKPGVDDPTVYRQAVTMRIVALRHAALAEPDPNDRDKALAAVEKEMQTVGKEEWARRNPTIMREEILLIESRGKYSGRAGAIVRWDAFRNLLRPVIDKSEAMKEMYWEATYHLAYCVYQEASLLKNDDARKKNIDRAAALINEARRVNFGTPANAVRYQELLANPKHRDLKDAADRLAQQAETTASSPQKTR
jgi:hypothetical protein